MSAGSSLINLVYVSEARRPMRPQELHDLMAQIVPRNREQGITGMLLYKDGCFIQALEGRASAVHETLARIRQDRRHQGVVVFHEEALVERQFPGWWMGFQDLNAERSDAGAARSPTNLTDFLQGRRAEEEWSDGVGQARVLMRAFRHVSAGFALPQSRGR